MGQTPTASIGPQMTAGPTRDREWVIRHLEHSSLGSLGRAVLGRMAEAGRVLEIHGGEFLIRAGEPGDELYVVLSGRLQVQREGDLLAEIGTGDLLGEIALLCQVPRVASVRAVRDSTILGLSRAVVKQSLHTMPEALFDLFEVVGRRLLQRTTMKACTPRVIALTSCGGQGTHAADAAEAYLESARAFEQVSVLRGTDPNARARLDELEAESEHVFLVTDSETTEWTRWCWRQADRIVVLCSASEQRATPVEQALYTARDTRIHARILLGLLHNSAPTEVRDLLTDRRPHLHFNLVQPECIERLLRCTLGKGVGLVLSGGAARGYAHVGVVRALAERGVPIDWVGGTSVGAATAAAIALWEGIDGVEVGARTIGCRAVVDFTPPFMGLAAGRQLKKRLIRLTGERDIEDLVLPFFAVATDLVAGEGIPLCHGRLWKAVRASMSIPGVYAPIRVGDAVCVDGGLVDNFPVSTMRDLPEIGVVIGVSLGSGGQIQASTVPEDGVFSGWKTFFRKTTGPSIVSVLFSTAQLTDQSGIEPDVLISPDVANTGLFEFAAGERLMETGYRAALSVLEAVGADFWRGFVRSNRPLVSTAELKTGDIIPNEGAV